MKSICSEIHIALGFDKNYIVHVYALLTSVLHNNKGCDLHFHVIATGITNTEKSDLEHYIYVNNAKISFYQLSEELVRSKVVIPAGTHFTIATYYRIFFPSLIDPGIKKLLYIDSDVIVIGNLWELYNTNIGYCPIAAAPDSGAELREDLGIYKKEDYFNAGVLLIDTKNWKGQNVTERVIKFLFDHPEKVKYVDQDALNATLIDNWYRISNKYNFTLLDVKLQVPSKELIKDVVIIHYTSWRKPWHCLTRNKLRYLYHDYLRLSPKAYEKKYTDLKWDIKTMWHFSRIRMKEFYFENRLNKILPVPKWINSPDLDY